ncbi:MAG: dTDP-4-dehydrorhamnose reductase [Phycisphaerae bacterium]|jgi:dTDP-4-dehydrorhamnose reductase|nr:dTDP-4-dehydrorhamnose reductase [Phycisphaerae bacterium]
MTVLVTGAGGQLANELVRTAPKGVDLVALSERELDITDPDAVERTVLRLRPEAIVNAAAYTAVDKAESDVDAAFLVNRDGARSLAESAHRHGAWLVHISTDFVFDGTSGTPYLPESMPHPVSVYGASKLAGDMAVRHACPSAAIIRTAWVYASEGKNFVHTMLRLMRERGSVRVVADQVGSPTNARGLAACCWRVIERKATGLFHWTDAGVASWYDFAMAIAELGMATGALSRPATVEPIRTADYPTPARRPAYSVLDKTSTWQVLGLAGEHWREPLRRTLEEIAKDLCHGECVHG